MNTVDKQIWKDFEAEGFKYPFMKKFKKWVENGCKPVVPESYYQASEKVRKMHDSGMTTTEIGRHFGISYNPIRDLINGKYSQIGDRIVNKVLQ